jgi:predicted DNA-binding protein (MmcQ/YjbR family)
MVNIESYREYCLSKPGTTEGLPFDENTLVFKVKNKIFTICDLNKFDFVNLKCDPDLAIDLRERYACVQPGFHMNKQHWNSVYIDGSVSDAQIFEWVNHSYDLIAASLPKKLKEELKNES